MRIKPFTEKENNKEPCPKGQGIFSNGNDQKKLMNMQTKEKLWKVHLDCDLGAGDCYVIAADMRIAKLKAIDLLTESISATEVKYPPAKAGGI